MIRVALHVSAGRRGGPRSYGVGLARALSRRADVDLVVLTDRPDLSVRAPTVHLKGPRPWADQVRAVRMLRQLSPDVYHNTSGRLPRRIASPSVVTIHDLAYHHFPAALGYFSRLFRRWQYEFSGRAADRVIALSQHARRDLIGSLNVSGEKVRVVPHGVADRFRKPPRSFDLDLEEPYILSVGTIRERRNLDVLVRAVARLRERSPRPFSLVVAGRKGLGTKSFEEACKLTPVRVLGVVPEEDLPALYARAAVFVQPSSYEGFGLTAAEAMACGTPVLAARAGSLPEVVGEAGLLVPPCDEEALAEALGKLLDHPDITRDLGEAGRKRSELFTWERSAEEHLAVYEEAAA
ncbi:MAG: glycosyltransferase family 4 protein [Planctomycetota bacterium]